MANGNEERFKLPERTKKELQNTEVTVNQARRMIEVLKKTGQDVSNLESMLDWAEETRQTLLKEFG